MIRKIYRNTAKKQLLWALKHLPPGLQIRCAHIFYWTRDKKENAIHVNLVTGYTEAEYKEFLEKLSFEYGYEIGTLMDGVVWFEGGGWLEFVEDDEVDSQWWEFRLRPEIPPHLERSPSDPV
ncbi:hypothetical protein H6G45_09230 [Synechocystis sp. FACHB-383]|uniref:hypothetical protein n=1 Tax=Synechocystis sp. FACHB-383 TaxID=2692864 RepID=UPI0016889A15|nr:hypothetical protein [Synechocystis sp. FACHB-383]MBD2653668.1 hypothetical protein [Synechocystis sp. FACHB-383]